MKIGDYVEIKGIDRNSLEYDFGIILQKRQPGYALVRWVISGEVYEEALDSLQIAARLKGRTKPNQTKKTSEHKKPAEPKKVKRIIRNSAKCLLCDDEISSLHRHDFVTCKCGNLSVDGGMDYCKRVAKDPSKVEETSIYN